MDIVPFRVCESSLTDTTGHLPRGAKSSLGHTGRLMIVTSTLPHALSLIPISGLRRRRAMAITIAISTTFSVLWHLAEEPTGWLYWMDYSAAGIWTVMEVSYSNRLNEAILLNLAVFCLHLLAGFKGDANYILYHSLWHLVSSSKCAWLAFRISQAEHMPRLRRWDEPVLPDSPTSEPEQEAHGLSSSELCA